MIGKTILLVLALLALGSAPYKGIMFKMHVGDYLQRTQTANTVELAKENLDTALNNFITRYPTTGYTSILYNTPDEDVGYWYRNLKAAQNELDEIDVNKITKLEQSNILMKLRESLEVGTPQGS